ncbi:MAG: M56 family metallopeptidase, partial [Clostridiales bacterium]|nr:M56 family metallopeptidase [Clostridiales bacterium]
MTDIFLGFLNRSLAAGILILAVVLVRLVFKKAPRWLLCALWALAAVRLVCPVSIESVLSLIPSAEPVQPEIIVSAQPAITSGIPAVDAIVNPPLAAAFTPSPAQSANPLQIWTFLAACVWLAGIAALLLYAAVSALRLRLRVRTAVRLEGKVYQSEFVSSPFILGVIRPRIYLPFGLEAGAQAMVLAHERAHLRRGDQLWKPLGYLILAAYWFNPLCWLAYILFCRDIEAACDEKVVRELGEGCKAAYSRALLACSAPKKLITACPLAFGETGVKSRIKSVLNYKKPAFWLVLAAVLASVAVAVCFLTDPKREDPAQNPPAAEEAAAQAPAQSIDTSSAPEPAIDEQAGLDPDFFTGTDGYGESVTVQALFTAATEAGGNWGAYLPATGWLQEPGRSLWCSEQTGAAFEVGYLPDV